MNILIALKHLFCKDFLRRKSDLVFLYASLTTSTLPLVLQHCLCTSWLPMSKKYVAVSWEPRDQNLPYECALKPQESRTWEKQAATYHSNRITIHQSYSASKTNSARKITEETMNTRSNHHLRMWKKHRFLNKLKTTPKKKKGFLFSN